MMTEIAALTPRLLPVPSFVNELVIKATHSGIIVLKEGRFKKRYTGSRTAAVDINGKFYEKAGDLKKALVGTDPKGLVRHKKKVAVPLQQPSENLNPYEGAQCTDKNLSPKRCEYRVNKMEVRQRLLTMINTMKGGRELYFWTVTFPVRTSDDLCYRAFNTWLTSLRLKKMLREYLWVAERQQNGTIHFHVAIPHKMSVVAANRMMRTTLATFAAKKLIDYSVYQCKRYNGIDISKNRKTGRVTNFAIKKGSRTLANYLTKYVTKNDGRFSHLAWHNSRGFSALFTGITFTVAEFLGYGFDKILLRRSVINNEFFMFFPWLRDPPLAITGHLFTVNSYLQELTESRITA